MAPPPLFFSRSPLANALRGRSRRQPWSLKSERAWSRPAPPRSPRARDQRRPRLSQSHARSSPPDPPNCGRNFGRARLRTCANRWKLDRGTRLAGHRESARLDRNIAERQRLGCRAPGPSPTRHRAETSPSSISSPASSRPAPRPRPRRRSAPSSARTTTRSASARSASSARATAPSTAPCSSSPASSLARLRSPSRSSSLFRRRGSRRAIHAARGSVPDGLYGSRHYARDPSPPARCAVQVWRPSGHDRRPRFNITLSRLPRELTREISRRRRRAQAERPLRLFRPPSTTTTCAQHHRAHPHIDLIDFDYLYWHTADDTLDRLAPESLQMTGAVTIYHLRKALK